MKRLGVFEREYRSQDSTIPDDAKTKVGLSYIASILLITTSTGPMRYIQP